MFSIKYLLEVAQEDVPRLKDHFGTGTEDDKALVGCQGIVTDDQSHFYPEGARGVIVHVDRHGDYWVLFPKGVATEGDRPWCVNPGRFLLDPAQADSE